MTIYDIDSRIAAVVASCIDEETGEITSDALAELNNLQMERRTKIDGIALAYKNVAAQADAVKREKLMLAQRQQRLERKAEWLKQYLADALGGEAITDDPRYTVSYRKSVGCEVQDEEQTVAWCKKNHADCVEVKETLSVARIKKLLSDGVDVPGAVLVERQNIQLR